MRSFFLTPLNYFDADVSIESKNAILLSAPVKPGDPFTYNDYGVKTVNCMPAPLPPFRYEGMKAFDLDGKPAPPATVEQLRKDAEQFHRIQVEL